MAKIMTLDGLDAAHLVDIRNRLDGAARPWWRRQVTLQGLTDHPKWIWALLGLIGGAWAAWSGTRLVKRGGHWMLAGKRR